MSVPHTSRAAILHEKGAKHVVSDRSLPAPGPGEVTIKITATAVNPADWKNREEGRFIPVWPTILGSDAAGEVAALGPDVSDFTVGDRVFFQGKLGHRDYCTFQQYCNMPADLLSRTPRNISDEQAAGIPVATIAVVVAFYDKSGRGLPAPWDEAGGQVGKGKAIVILGGASSCGQYAIQLARLSGFERIVTTASPKHHEFLTNLGAHVTLDRHTTTAEDIREAIDGLPLEFVFDAPSTKETQTLGIETVRATNTRDTCVITLFFIGDEVRSLAESVEPAVPIRYILGVGWDPKLFYLSKSMAKHLGGEDGWIAKGLLVPNRPMVVVGGLANLEEALDKVKRGVSGEKVVIRPWDK
ncbi:probable NADPH:quinone reductase and related Zn-dependent oxidoreductases [Cephalotrichum gorgonifer]|uniref:Probable NADPH:quinone reductase and related Zn-dependent oxidoreductases n=1 Tax=Cephalotrichum gorgonifer TaxID=2041049 RepID=A0AAE8N3T8_9PEZI|nr:probable NADPH:quinone reductase and related Zn-dependent oxidoreductases [Cephalotrichum gorgonifer]